MAELRRYGLDVGWAKKDTWIIKFSLYDVIGENILWLKGDIIAIFSLIQTLIW